MTDSAATKNTGNDQKSKKKDDDPFAGDGIGYPFSYGFVDVKNLPIPNALGYEFIRLLKGTTNVFADDVREILRQHDRDELLAQYNLHKD